MALETSVVDRLTTLPPDQPGQATYRVDAWATAVFIPFAVLAAAWPGPLRIPFAVYSCALFGLGTVAFLGAYGRALGRSRTDQISVGGIYGLSGSCPKDVQRRFHILTAVQSVVAIATAIVRPFTAQAFGILVPMLGIGLGGLWAATHGTFPARRRPRDRARAQVEEALTDE